MLVGETPLGPDALRQGDRRALPMFLASGAGWQLSLKYLSKTRVASAVVVPTAYAPPGTQSERRAPVRPVRRRLCCVMTRLLNITMKSRGRLMQSAAMSSPARR